MYYAYMFIAINILFIFQSQIKKICKKVLLKLKESLSSNNLIYLTSDSNFIIVKAPIVDFDLENIVFYIFSRTRYINQIIDNVF